MAILWQLILIGVLSVWVGSQEALGYDYFKANQSSNVVSYTGQPKQNLRYLQEYQTPLDGANVAQLRNQQLDDMDTAPANGYAQLDQQHRAPKVYHSIIDATNIHQQEALSPAVQASTSTTGDLNTAAGHHHGHSYGKYYDYRAVPKKKTWKFGYKRGNHKHTISRHEHGKAGKHPHFKTKVKWHDHKSKGKGIHLWDYNHHDKKHHYG